MPALELTLTDTQDQAVVRRVLMPAELGAASGRDRGRLRVVRLASALAVAPTATGDRIAGYRLLAFYP